MGCRSTQRRDAHRWLADIAGWPTKLAIPPYEDQTKRLFVRLDSVRGRIDHDDPRWLDEQAEALVAFRKAGQLPDDELQLEALLVDVELNLLAAHRRGKDVVNAMALFERVAQAEGEERGELLEDLSATAAEAWA